MLKISICIPNYRRPLDLLKAVEDCQKQTVAPYEIIVQDDNSPEKELGIIKKNLPKNIIFIQNRKTLGMIENVNSVIKRAKGDYVAVVHNDDRLSSRYLEEICYWIKKYPSFNIYTTNGIGLNRNGKITGEFRLFPKSKAMKRGEGIKHIWQHDYFTLISINGTSIYKKSFIKKNLFDDRLHTEADLSNSLGFLKKEDIFYIDRPVYFVGLNENQESSKNKLQSSSLNRYIENCYRIYKSYAKDFKDIPFFLQKIKAMYFLALLLKYGYKMKDIRRMLELNSPKEISSVLILIPLLMLNFLTKKIGFFINYRNIAKFKPS